VTFHGYGIDWRPIMNCYFSLCKFVDELVLGIATGLYTGGIVTQLVRFEGLKNQGLYIPVRTKSLGSTFTC
jgi:hypothetical protein